MTTPRLLRATAVSLATALIVGSGSVSDPPAQAGVAPTLTVDTTEDSFDGSCVDGDCSLRDAVKSAPAGARVLVPAGLYPLTITGDGGIGTGSIELRRRITIVGEDEEAGAFIDGTLLEEPVFTTAPRTETPTRFTLAELTVFGARNPSLAGGALAADGGSLRLVRVTVADGLADLGGGIAVGPIGRLELVDSLVIGNEATTAGGGIWNEGVATMTDSAVVSNRAVDGGAIATSGVSQTSLGNVTIAENTAAGDGGGTWFSGPAEITAATIGDNDATRGGGIMVAPGATGPLDIERSIVAGNRADRGRQCTGALVSLGDNVDSGHRCGFDSQSDLQDADPLIRRLGPNGGPTPTMSLSVRSPARDLAGDCGGRDQRGAPRDRRCDAGAYEVVRCLGRPVNIVGTAGADELSGGRSSDAFLGLGGDDQLQGSIGKDRMCGGPGDDLLISGPGSDRSDGEAGNDRVQGESGDDGLVGGPGRDRLVGGPGEDTCEASSRDRPARGCELFFTGAARRAFRGEEPYRTRPRRSGGQ